MLALDQLNTDAVPDEIYNTDHFEKVLGNI